MGSGDGKTRQRASSMCETLVIIQLLHTDHTEKPQTRRTDRQKRADVSMEMGLDRCIQKSRSLEAPPAKGNRSIGQITLVFREQSHDTTTLDFETPAL